MRRFLRSTTFQLLLALLIGLGLGLTYSWKLAPVTYVDANPALLQTDFKDQYRVVIAASYAATHNLDRARARLASLSDTDPIGELSAQAQRMVGNGETLEDVQSLAQLATDLQQGFVSVSNIHFTSTPFTNVINTSVMNTPAIETLSPTETEIIMEETAALPTLSFEQTPLIPQATATPRPTFTPIPPPGAPFTLVGQDPICEPGTQPGLLQFILMDSRRKQVAGIEIIVTWSQGEDRFFTGFKPELGNGYADFVMQADTVYSVRVVDGGTFVPNISAPLCSDPNGIKYPGGLLLTFQQP